MPLGVVVTTANIRDSKAAYRLIGSIGARHPYIKTIKAENGYRGKRIEVAKQAMAIDMRCVKSNFGTSEFILWRVAGLSSARLLGLIVSADYAATASSSPRRQRWRSWPS